MRFINVISLSLSAIANSPSNPFVLMSAHVTKKLIAVFATAILAIGLSVGCSPESKIERHLTSAKKHLAAGQYDAAEIDFLNVQRIDARNGTAIAGLGIIYFDQGSLSKATPRLLAARELVPDNLEARSRLARAYFALGRKTDARTEALAILELGKNDPIALQILAESSITPTEIAEMRGRLTTDDAPSHVALAILALNEQKLVEATEYIERALVLDVGSVPAHTVMAAIHIARSDVVAATASLRTAARLSTARSPQRLGLARFLLSRGDREGGQTVLEETLNLAPDFLPASVMLAELAATGGDYDKAQKLLSGVLARDTFHPEATMMRARIHLARGENVTAIEILERLVSRYPDATAAHYLLASAYVAANDTNRALTSLARALQLAPDHADAIILRSALQMRAGDPASAVPALRELVKKNPDLPRARILLADALRARGQAEEALEVYRAAIAASPQDPQLQLFAGGLLAQLGRTAEARAAFERALTLAPDFIPAVEQLVALDLAAQDLPAAARRAQEFATAHADRAEAHILAAKVAVAQRDPDRAEASLRRAIEVSPDSATAYLLLAQLFLDGKHQDEALTNLQAAAAKNPRDITALMLIGILQQQKGELDAARAAYEKLLATNPRFVPALNNLAYLYSESFGELDKAYDLANRAREIRPNDPIALDTFGWILFQKREYNWASSVLSESASKLTDNAEVQYHLGLTRYMLGDETGARTALSFAANSAADFPGKDKARIHLAILNIDTIQASDDSLAMLRERIAAMPDDPVALSRMAAIHAACGRPTEALTAYEAALKANPNNATAIVNLARFLGARPADRPRAFELAKSAYKIAPENPEVLHVLGRLAYDNGDQAWAASLLRETVRRVPESAEAQYDLATAAYAVGQIADAMSAARAALQTPGPFSRTADAREFLDLVEAATAQPLPADANARARAALAGRPASVPALMLAAAVQESTGDSVGATETYEQIIATLPSFTPAKKRAAILLARENPPGPRAHEAATRAREALPNDPEIAAALGTVLYRRGEYPRAATLLSEGARSPQATPETHYLLGMAQQQLGDKVRSRASLQRAIDLGLSGEAGDSARKALATP